MLYFTTVRHFHGPQIIRYSGIYDKVHLPPHSQPPRLPLQTPVPCACRGFFQGTLRTPNVCMRTKPAPHSLVSCGHSLTPVPLFVLVPVQELNVLTGCPGLFTPRCLAACTCARVRASLKAATPLLRGVGELVEGCPAGRKAGVRGLWEFLLIYSSFRLTCSILFGEGRVSHGLMMFVSCVSIKHVCLVTHRLFELTDDILGEAGQGYF